MTAFYRKLAPASRMATPPIAQLRFKPDLRIAAIVLNLMRRAACRLLAETD
ncbi:hypothetical protein [Methylosinus sp. KRF6]|uniref:hypothetical protein n=1 Tax=Methylosinus TaxID=425 RepID=UPI001C0A9597|nr:hypothetical protein [Methylosinus sp. KRF6]MBU3887859.1 hypothetical protein [Methylosinus sp. KRF6]